ncbi:hypothetical protein J6590_078170, partial [Homalodisca vitripennis]
MSRNNKLFQLLVSFLYVVNWIDKVPACAETHGALSADKNTHEYKFQPIGREQTLKPLTDELWFQRTYVIKCSNLSARKRVRRLSQDNQIKQRRAWLLLGWLTAERSCPCKRPACPAIGGGSEVTFKPLVPRLSVREGFLALTSP